MMVIAPRFWEFPQAFPLPTLSPCMLLLAINALVIVTPTPSLLFLLSQILRFTLTASLPYFSFPPFPLFLCFSLLPFCPSLFRCTHLNTRLSKLTQELREEQEMNRYLRANQTELQAQLQDEQRKAHEVAQHKDLAIGELQEQLRDVMFYLEAQRQIDHMPDEARQEIQEGQINIAAAPAPPAHSSSGSGSAPGGGGGGGGKFGGRKGRSKRGK